MSNAGSVAPALRGHFVPRLVAGLAILLTWELVVRLAAPAYVAKPSGIVVTIGTGVEKDEVAEPADGGEKFRDHCADQRAPGGQP